jgi:hypothetical protein
MRPGPGGGNVDPTHGANGHDGDAARVRHRTRQGFVYSADSDTHVERVWETGLIHFLPGVALGDAGQYSLRATNSCGTITSRIATLAVQAPPAIQSEPGWPTAPGQSRYGG